MSDYLVGGLSIVDHGAEPLCLTPDIGYLYLANLAVHAGRTRRIGGFSDANLGPVGKTAGFGDDIELQRLMAKGGLKVLYEPRARVYHRISPDRLKRSTMLDRRYRTGLDYARSRSSGARQAGIMASCILRGVVATLRDRPADAMDRFAYAAQCAGELRGRLAIARPDSRARGGDAR